MKPTHTIRILTPIELYHHDNTLLEKPKLKQLLKINLQAFEDRATDIKKTNVNKNSINNDISNIQNSIPTGHLEPKLNPKRAFWVKDSTQTGDFVTTDENITSKQINKDS